MIGEWEGGLKENGSCEKRGRKVKGKKEQNEKGRKDREEFCVMFEGVLKERGNCNGIIGHVGIGGQGRCERRHRGSK